LTPTAAPLSDPIEEEGEGEGGRRRRRD